MEHLNLIWTFLVHSFAGVRLGMEDLRSLKQMYEDGYVVESEYNRRRLALINQITGKNYTMEDILAAENKGKPGAAPSAPAPVASAPMAPAPVPTLAAPTPFTYQAPSQPQFAPQQPTRAPAVGLDVPPSQRITITPPDLFGSKLCPPLHP